MKIPVRMAGNSDPEDNDLESGGNGRPVEDDTPETPVAENKTAPAGETESLSADEWKNRYVRLYADFENFKRHANLERERLSGIGKEAVLDDVLPLVGYMELAINAVETAPDKAAIIAGLDLLYKQLIAALEKHGVERIPAQGQPFDPTVHEAISVYVCTDTPDNTIIQEVKPGFRRHGKVLRPATVVVAQNKLDR
jgi:molecular chaperone GrpE